MISYVRAGLLGERVIRMSDSVSTPYIGTSAKKKTKKKRQLKLMSLSLE